VIADAKESDYQQAMDRLKLAAQKLRDAAQALADEPATERAMRRSGKSTKRCWRRSSR
jgi:hypothetical protein